VTDRVIVMYAGRVVESGPTEALFARRAHPYTQGLFNARPRHAGRSAQRAKLDTIPGVVPDPRALTAGCAFADRCRYAVDLCRQPPPLITVADGHYAQCHRVREWL